MHGPGFLINSLNSLVSLIIDLTEKEVEMKIAGGVSFLNV